MGKKIVAIVFVLTILLLGCTNKESQLNVGSDFRLTQYMPDDENYVISPLSIKMAMMMAANGATGKTQQEILDAFDVTDIKKYNEFSKDIIKRYSQNDKVKIDIANSIWLNETEAGSGTFKKEFKNNIKSYFGGTTNIVNSDNAVEKINKWCNDKTKGNIKEVIDNSDFVAALVNAVYFKGDWSNQFNKNMTRKDKFVSYDGSEIEKDFMQQTDYFNYYEDETMQMVEIPYADDTTSMYVVLNKNKSEINVEEALDKMENVKVHIKLPKFKIEFSEKLNDTLKKMGIQKAFSDTAEFDDSMFTDLHDINIDRVIHKVYIDVDEKGTEAAAVTAVIMTKNAVMDQSQEEIKQFIADKPFSYFIRDNESGAILFMGQMVK